MKRLFLFIVLISAACFSAVGQLRLHSLISDNMVLQQNASVTLWGWSAPSATVSISTQWGEKVTVKADGNGDWKCSVATPAASFTPYEITVRAGKESAKIENVLIGEVWVCSGQSNMEMIMKGYKGCPVEGYQDFVSESTRLSAIRHFKVEKVAVTEPQKDVEGEWQPASPQVLADFGSLPYLFARELFLNLNVPIGVINTSWGGSCIEAWMSAESQQKFSDVDLSKAFDEKIKPTKRPVTIFNGMLIPIVNYTIKGFCWYQGSSNTGSPMTYADKMVTMIDLWRGLWHNDSLPFYYVELAPYVNRNADGFNYPLLREQQAMVMKMRTNTGMVPTNDLVYPYEVTNIHPTQKANVAKRLAAWALSRDYGYGENLRTIGPSFKSVEYADGKAVVSFNNSEQGFGFRGEPVGFEIAGEDGVFYPAGVSRKSFGSTELIVWSDSVPNPVAVRYCFRNCLLGNVFDNYGLPITPFRTDTAPLL